MIFCATTEKDFLGKMEDIFKAYSKITLPKPEFKKIVDSFFKLLVDENATAHNNKRPIPTSSSGSVVQIFHCISLQTLNTEKMYCCNYSILVKRLVRPLIVMLL